MQKSFEKIGVLREFASNEKLRCNFEQRKCSLETKGQRKAQSSDKYRTKEAGRIVCIILQKIALNLLNGLNVT